MAAGVPQETAPTARVTRKESFEGGFRGSDELWTKIYAALLAVLFAILAFFGREMFADVNMHTVQLATLTERVDDIKEKVDKLAVDSEQNGRSLAEIKGFLQASA